MSDKIIVVGSLNADFVINVERFPVPGETLTGQDFKVFPGGKGANQACAVGRLGGCVHMVGQVGNDAQAGWLKGNLAAAGVDVSHVAVDASVSSGIATITIDGLGQNQIIIVPGANGTFSPERLRACREVFDGSRMVLLQLEIPLETVEAAAAMARAAGAQVILDPAPARHLSDALLASVDFLTPNETELAILTDVEPRMLTRTDAARLGRQLLERGARNVIVKLGPKGALWLHGTGEHFWRSLPVKAVDTTAAGDAFNGAFAFALSVGKPVEQAGRFACAAAAISVTRPGAQPSMPTLAEVESLLKEHP